MNSKVEAFIESKETKAAATLVSYQIRNSDTERDDEVLENIDEYAQAFAGLVRETAIANPNEREAKKSLGVIVHHLVKKTKTKLDDFAARFIFGKPEED